MYREDEIDEILKKLSGTDANQWLIKAIKQRNSHLTVGVAYSELLIYDKLDRRLLAAINNSEKN